MSDNDVARHAESDLTQGDEVHGPLTRREAKLSVEYSEQYSGQFPHWTHLAEYKRIHEDAPRIIFESFEKQGDHRREMEKKLMAGSERRASIGQFLGTGVILVGLIGGFALAFTGREGIGLAVVGVALTSGVLSYVFGDFVPGRKSK